MTLKTTSITAKILRYYIEYPLRSDGSTYGLQPPVLHCTENMAGWLIEVAAGRQPNEDESREFFDRQWRRTGFFQSRDAVSPDDYNDQVEEGVLVCSCVRDLGRRCEILQPLFPYSLTIDSITISGEHAVMHSRRKIKTFIPYSSTQPVVNHHLAVGYDPAPMCAGHALSGMVGAHYPPVPP